MALFSRTLMAGVALATFGVALPATANLYDDQALPEYAGPSEETGQSIEVILTVPEGVEAQEVVSAESSADLPPVDMRDFDIEDFIGADGQIDLDKLRAYEDAQLGIVMREMSPDASTSSAGNDSQKIEDADIFVWTEDGLEAFESPDQNAFTFETETQTPSSEYTDPWDTPTTYESRHIYEDIQQEAEAEPVWDEPSPQTSTHEIEPETLSEARSRTRSAVARIEKLLGNLRNNTPEARHNHDMNSDLEVMTIDLRGAPKSDAARTISLSGETQIVIGEDGTITITNNGQSVVPLAMAAGHSGKAAAMVMDNDAPAKITVSKTINIDNGKRHVHVEVDMESETGDAWNSHN